MSVNTGRNGTHRYRTQAARDLGIGLRRPTDTNPAGTRWTGTGDFARAGSGNVLRRPSRATAHPQDGELR